MMDVSERVTELLKEYPLLHKEAESDKQIKLSGDIKVHRSIEQYVINRTYSIEIYVPMTVEDLPYVVYTGNAINNKYPHMYKDGKLCLATDIDMRLAFREDASLAKWMKDFVEPFFVIYEYYERYGYYPSGDRAHGAKGIVQSYMEIFDVTEKQASHIMLFMWKNRYRGHQPCPCGSGERIRNCHGKRLLEFYNDPVLFDQVRKDCDSLVQELNSYNRK